MGRQRTSRPDTRPHRLLPQAVRTELYNHLAAGFRLFQSQLKFPIPSPAPRPAPRSFSAGVTFALQTFRPALCLPCCVRPRPLPGRTNSQGSLEPLGGPAANAHAVGGLRAGIGGEATALCPHSGRAELGGPWGTPGAKMASVAEGDVGTVAELARVLRWGFEELSLNKLATSLGASEQALRLIISIFMGYPMAVFYRRYLYFKDSYLIHLFHAFTGLSIAYFNFGNQLYHSLLCVGLQFLILRLMGRTVTAVLTTFCFQMAYLLAGYYYTATGNYDIKWTMPHCVLTLKLIGECWLIAFPFYP
uniref:Lysophosphatidylcholine acyltransferase 3 n=1 Tax=Felis catus TaxID=9685 RepID=A0ABI7YNS4_FELCA